MGPVYRQGCNRGREECREGDDSGRAGLALQALRVTRKQKYSENGNRGTAKSGTRIQ